MTTKLIYWIPVIGVFVTLFNYDKDNGMGSFWIYYQAFTTILFIMIITFLSFAA